MASSIVIYRGNHRVKLGRFNFPKNEILQAMC